MVAAVGSWVDGKGAEESKGSFDCESQQSHTRNSIELDTVRRKLNAYQLERIREEQEFFDWAVSLGCRCQFLGLALVVCSMLVDLFGGRADHGDISGGISAGYVVRSVGIFIFVTG